MLLFAFFAMAIFSACEQQRDIDLKEDVETRKEVYSQILNDEELFNEFMDEMRESRRSMQWMHANRPMMRNMYSRRQVQAMMQENPEALDSLMQGMMSTMQGDTTRMNRRMRQNWLDLMERDTTLYRQMQERYRQREKQSRN